MPLQPPSIALLLIKVGLQMLALLLLLVSVLLQKRSKDCFSVNLLAPHLRGLRRRSQSSKFPPAR
jgi:hypothetical protein